MKKLFFKICLSQKRSSKAKEVKIFQIHFPSKVERILGFTCV